MEKYDVKFKKKFGQNFLKDVSIVSRIVGVADIDKEALVIEVGPGGAIMTRELAKVAKNVLAYEIDTELQEELNKRICGFDNIDLLFCDFLTADLGKDVLKYEYDNLYFVSNVPYYITTPIIMKLINSGLQFKKIVMMVQKEVGDRFSNCCGSRDYSSISVLLQYYFNVKKEFLVPRKEFIPVPNVDSVVISFTERKDKPFVSDFKFFEQVVRDSFQFKRKNLRNNLKKYNLDIISDVLKKYGKDLSARAEALDVDVFVDLANALYNK